MSQLTPLNIEFQNLKRNRAFRELMTYLQDSVIQKAKDDFFLMDDAEHEKEQKLRVRHYEEFLKKLKTIVENNATKN